MVYQQQIDLSTRGHRDMHDVTGAVAEIVRASGVTTGLVNVHVIGSTGAVGAIEFEPGLQRDLPEILDRLMPPSRDYGHEQAWHDGNATRTFRPRCSARRCRSRWAAANPSWAPGNRFFSSNATSSPAAGRSW